MRLLRVLVIPFLISLPAIGAPAGSDGTGNTGYWVAGAQFDAGFMMAHRPVIAYLQRNHAHSFQCYALKRTDGSSSWHLDYGRPLFGFSYRATDFGNREEIGVGHSAVMMARFPLMPKSTTWESALDFGYGLGFIERPFDVESNYKNLASGSVLNAAFSLALSTSCRVSRNLRIRGGLDFLHMSNGAAKMPNLGLNVPGIFFGMNYQFNPTSPTPGSKSTAIASTDKNTDSTYPYGKSRLYGAFGLKEIYPPNGVAYPIYALIAQHHRTIGRKGLLGGGVDLIDDTSLPTKKSRESREAEKTGFEASFRAGVFGSAGLRMGPWSIYLQTGAYIANPVKSDGDMYNRLALHYQFKKGLFLCMNLKSHFGKADYIEWGAGYSF